MVHDTDIIELELKSKKFTLNLRKKEAIQAEQPVVQVRALNMAAIGGTAPPSRRAV
jgi:acetyl-CoA carboxylase biotin carboxyl carrier protein